MANTNNGWQDRLWNHMANSGVTNDSDLIKGIKIAKEAQVEILEEILKSPYYPKNCEGGKIYVIKGKLEELNNSKK